MSLKDHISFYTNPYTNRQTLRTLQRTQEMRNAAQRNRNLDTENAWRPSRPTTPR
ncbi:MAG: hypothetical protein ACLFV7_12270 [Phycisphaerae bacterium]